MNSVLLERVRNLLSEKNMTQKALAAKLGMEYNTLWRKLSGDRKANIAFLQNLAQELDTSIAFLSAETDDPTPSSPYSDRRLSARGLSERSAVGAFGRKEELSPLKPTQILVPILDQEACAGEGFNFDDIETSAIGWLPWPLLEMGGDVNPNTPYFIRVQGDSMTGVDIDDGDFVLVNPNVEVTNGNSVYVKWNGHCSIKGFVHYPDGRVELRPANPNYQSIWIDDIDDENLQILGKIVRWTVSGIPKSVI
jgi:phage repressor protein C with HTH and peptisase S24 domain